MSFTVKSICKIRTRYYVARIHGVFVLDKAEAIHKLNLGNLAGAMGVEVVLNIGLGSYNHKVQSASQVSTIQLLDSAVMHLSQS